MHPATNSKFSFINTGLLLAKELIEAEMIAKISSSEVLHDHVEVLAVLEGGDHVDDEGIAELVEDCFFVDD